MSDLSRVGCGLLFFGTLGGLLIYLSYVDVEQQRLEQRQRVKHGRVAAWMLIGWILLPWLASLNGWTGSDHRFRGFLEAYWMVHGAILGAVIGCILDLGRNGFPRLSSWRFSLRALLLFVLLMAGVAFCVRQYVALFWMDAWPRFSASFILRASWTLSPCPFHA